MGMEFGPDGRRAGPPGRALVAAAVVAGVAAAGLGFVAAGIAGALTAVVAFALAAAMLLRVPGPVVVDPLQRLRDALAIAGDSGFAVAALDEAGVLRTANAPHAALLPGSDVPGQPLADLIDADDRRALAAAVANVASGTTRSQDLRVRARAAPHASLLLTIARPVGRPGLTLFTKESSFQLRLETQVNQAAKMQALGQLAGGLAHDFNNILTAIVGHSDLLLMRHGVGSIDHHDADQIRQNSRRAANLIGQLLAFARQGPVRARIVDLGTVVSGLGDLLRRLLGEPVRLEIAAGGAPAYVRIDPGQVEQALVNLAVNARDAMPSGGVLRLSVRHVPAAEVAAEGDATLAETDHVVLAVEDTGEGISEGVLPRIFDPFFTTKDIGEGTGLGLAMVYGIVNQSGGKVLVASTPGEGTRFSLFLPAAPPPPSEPPSEPVRSKPSQAAQGWAVGTILLVEDEPMVLAVAARALTRNGYTVLPAAGAEEALSALAGSAKVDLLVTDVVMRGIDGPALVHRARALRPGLRALFISGYAEEQVRARLDLPDVPLLPKPFTLRELYAAIAEQLAAPA